MGLNVPALVAFKRCLPAKKVLCLGYPDLVAKQEDLHRIFGVNVQKTADNGRWHGLNHELPDTQEFFSLIGCDPTYLDISPSRGVEIVRDLNFPVDVGKYDLVIDPGTIEHCFHIGQALQNAAGAVAPGGSILHTTPMSMLNHGFYNVCPTLLHDFYSQNGWGIELFVGCDTYGHIYEIHPTMRQKIPHELSIFVIARRGNDCGTDIPKQSKYLANPNLH